MMAAQNKETRHQGFLNFCMKTCLGWRNHSRWVWNVLHIKYARCTLKYWRVLKSGKKNVNHNTLRKIELHLSRLQIENWVSCIVMYKAALNGYR